MRNLALVLEELSTNSSIYSNSKFITIAGLTLTVVLIYLDVYWRNVKQPEIKRHKK